MKEYKIYTRITPDGKIYIGCTSEKNVCNRWHKDYSFDDSNCHNEVIGVYTCDQTDADLLETYYIIKYDSVRLGHNKNYGYGLGHWYKFNNSCCTASMTEYIELNRIEVLSRLESYLINKGYF